MAQNRIGKIEDIPCVRCGVTRHTIRGSFEAAWHHDEADISGGSTYDLMECNGCRKGTMRETSWCSEWPDEEEIEYWPPRPTSNGMRQPRDFELLDYNCSVESVYRQTITAFNSQLPTLAGAGIRMVIEGVCVDQNILKGKIYTEQGKLVRDKETKKIVLKDTLEGKINGLHSKGLISKNQAKILHQLRKFGNEAAHALDQPSLKLIEECIDSIEHLLVQVYDQPGLLIKLVNRKKPKKRKR